LHVRSFAFLGLLASVLSLLPADMPALLSSCLLLLGLGGRLTHSLRYDAEFAEYNLNQNASASDPLDYGGQWDGHTYTPSPGNWRFPFYTLFLDKFVNGDPANDNINGTVFEHDMTSTQLRHGGDLQGLIDSLDYIQGMGAKVGDIYIH
jgi:alpha-1,3-glucan synthase